MLFVIGRVKNVTLRSFFNNSFWRVLLVFNNNHIYLRSSSSSSSSIYLCITTEVIWITIHITKNQKNQKRLWMIIFIFIFFFFSNSNLLCVSAERKILELLLFWFSFQISHIKMDHKRLASFVLNSWTVYRMYVV